MNLGKMIQSLRKEKGFTQQELAEKLFVSYQAVSQWENGNTNPDVALIPSIAEVFGISIDELFGKKKEISFSNELNIKNCEEDTLYIILAEGKKLLNVLDYQDVRKNYKDVKIFLEGDVKNVKSHFSVSIEGEAKGSVTAGDGVNCGNVGGSVTAGDGVNCGNVGGSVNAGDGINCGNVGGLVTAGDSINCGNIGGSATAGDVIQCGDIYGNVSADEINCNNITATTIKAEKIHVDGDVTYKTN